jgi:hypothetical protein
MAYGAELTFKNSTSFLLLGAGRRRPRRWCGRGLPAEGGQGPRDEQSGGAGAEPRPLGLQAVLVMVMVRRRAPVRGSCGGAGDSRERAKRREREPRERRRKGVRESARIDRRNQRPHVAGNPAPRIFAPSSMLCQRHRSSHVYWGRVTSAP